MLVEDPVLRVGLRPSFQSWDFVFSNANFFHMPVEREEKRIKRNKYVYVVIRKKHKVSCAKTLLVWSRRTSTTNHQLKASAQLLAFSE